MYLLGVAGVFIMSPSREFPPDFRLLLASQSPRRRELLDALGVPYQVVESTGDEHERGEDPGAVAVRNALAKARGAALPADARGAFVLGTDTIVVVDGTILGKPSEAAHAREMLGLLAGRTHRVVSGVALIKLGAAGEAVARALGQEETAVHMAPMSDLDREAYVTSGEWEGKAGGYAIQGLAALLVDRIEGDYSNVVGLPLALVGRLFSSLGFDLLRAAWVTVDAERARNPQAGIILGSGATRQEG